MAAESYPFKIAPKVSTNRWGRWFLTIFLLTLSLTLWLLFLLHESEPNYYQPARAALVAARHRLNEYYSHESVIIQQLHKAHQELDATMSMLDKAENLDPADRQRLDELRARLGQLDDVKRATRMSPDQLHDSYQKVAEELDELIHKLELPNP